MKIFTESIELTSSAGQVSFHKITEAVCEMIQKSEISNGFVVVYSHHTTCSVMFQECSFDINEDGLEYMQQDLVDALDRILPVQRTKELYHHPGKLATDFAATQGELGKEALNTDAHLRSVFIGRSETIVIQNGKPDLGDYGHLYFIDFDQTHQRKRKIQVQIIGE
jgi:secondary thiamine-phosphate synthase enzyme